MKFLHKLTPLPIKKPVIKFNGEIIKDFLMTISEFTTKYPDTTLLINNLEDTFKCIDFIENNQLQNQQIGLDYLDILNSLSIKY